MIKNKFILIFVCILLFISCKNAEDNIAVIWSNKVEFASYCELFNASQDKYRIILEYKENPAQALVNSDRKSHPDIVIGAWLKGSAVRKKFCRLNYVLKKDKIDPSTFYSELLSLGHVGYSQILLPVNFNLPAMIFVRDSIKLNDEFAISLDEIRNLSAKFNKLEKGSYVRMGFSPKWNDEFLYLTAKGFYSNFEEDGKSFVWDTEALNKAILYLRQWAIDFNTSSQYENDFKFKYLYDPPYATVASNRCLFQYVESDALLMLPAGKVKNIDFRWLAYNEKTPINDEILYAGIYSKARNKKSATAFLIWFFDTKNQAKLLKRSSESDLKTHGFGIAGGFSAIKPVTENIFPTYYPLLLSHLPQTKNFMVPNILPSDWQYLKQTVLLPYLKSVTDISENDDVNVFNELDSSTGFKNK